MALRKWLLEIVMARGSSSKRKLHPVVQALEADRDTSALDTLRSLPQAGEPVVAAMIAIQEAVQQDAAARKRALKLARHVPLGGDPDLMVVFLAYRVYLASSMGHSAEMVSLVRTMRSLVGASTSACVRCWVMTCQGLLASAFGDNARREQLYRDRLKLRRRGSRPYWADLLDMARFLALRGKATEVEKQLREVPEKYFNRDWADAIRLIQCAETGRLEEGFKVSAELGEAHGSARFVENSLVLMGLMSMARVAAGEQLDAEEAKKALDVAETASALVGWPRVTRELLERRPQQALQTARAAARDEPMVAMNASWFVGFSLIRAELANRNARAARRLLEMRREGGNTHYLDDLFLARVALLERDMGAAAERFGRALRSCEKWKARERMDFELRLACEISPLDLLSLSQALVSRVAGRKHAVRTAPGRASESRGTDRLIGPSAALEEVRGLIRKFAGSEAAVLITGETGTGKELVARAIHESGPRSGEPFLAVNCGAIPEGLLESELFGHERGAFTGAVKARPGIFREAGRGTVLLDEISEIPARLQVALLRVLENSEVRPVGGERARKTACRILAATNADLEARHADRRFRRDLLYRLRRLEIRIPPLRERPRDVLPLVHHFLSEGRDEAETASLSPALGRELRDRKWTGNVRELRNAIERMRLLNSDKTAFDLTDLGLESEARSSKSPDAAAQSEEVSPGAVPEDEHAGTRRLLRGGSSVFRREELLRELFRQHLRLTRGEVARIMSVSPNTAGSYLKRLRENGFIEKVMPTRAPRTHYFQLRGAEASED
jgi:DNA-binding NtrC family response regulator